MADVRAPFRINSLDHLQTNATVDAVWNRINNDEFWALRRYVEAATGVAIEGYGRREGPGADAALHQTVEELVSVVDVLNGMPGFVALRDHLGNEGDDGKLDALIQEMRDALAGRVSTGLLERIELELGAWVTRLSDGRGLSDLIDCDGTDFGGADEPLTDLGQGAVDWSLPGGTLLRPGAREIIEFAGATAAARRASSVEPVDVILAAILRPLHTELDQRELTSGASYALFSLVDAGGESARQRLDRGLAVLGTDSKAVVAALRGVGANTLVKRYLHEPGGVDRAVGLASDVGAAGVYSHHVIVAELGDDLPTAVLDALGTTTAELLRALRKGVDDRWPQEAPDLWDFIVQDDDLRTRLSRSVWSLRSRLGPADPVTASAIARELQEHHPGYAHGGFGSVELHAEQGATRTVDDWLRAVIAMYDPARVAASRHEVIDGELVIAALAELDIDLRTDLDADGFLGALLDEVEVRPHPPLEPRGRQLPGASSDGIPLPGNGNVRRADRLNTAAEVEMIVSVLLAEKTPLPLALGLFGDWGSGKSFFMALMQERMEELSALAAKGSPEAAPYCKHVRSVRFNAWHYVDADLWSSLATTLFDQLANKARPDAAAATISELNEAEKKLTAATKDRVKAEQDVEVERERSNRPKASLDAAIIAARNDPQLRSNLKAANADAETFVDAVGELHGFAAEANATWRLARAELGSGRRAATLILGVVAVAVLGAVWLLGDLGALGKLGSVIVAVIAVLTPALQGARSLLRLAQDARVKREAPLLKAEKELTAKRTVELEKQQKVDHLRSRLDEMRNKGQAIQDFIRARADSSDYRARLGVVSLLRRDFEDLASLLHPKDDAEAQKVAATAQALKEDLPDLDRIVLFIDDLDRCPHEKVVDVLQAVHLLLAFDLFVVVVGVDSRWLERSLESHYETLLVDPSDYLEKIFQISYALRPMNGTEFTSLVDSLTPRASADGKDQGSLDRSTGAATDKTADDGSRASSDEALASSEEAGAQKDENASSAGSTTEPQPTPEPTPVPAPPSPEALEITDQERRLLGQLAGIVVTPRSTKRLVNIYRMLRVSVPDDEYERFLPGSGDEYQAVVLLLGLLVGQPAVAQDFFRALHDADDDDDIWTVMARCDGASVALAPIRDDITPTTCEPYRRWAPRIARFSFRLTRDPRRRPQAPVAAAAPATVTAGPGHGDAQPPSFHF